MNEFLHGQHRLNLIKKDALKGRLKEAVKAGRYAEAITSALSDIKDISTFRLDPDLVLLTMSVVEVLVPRNHNWVGVQSKKYVDKKGLIMEIHNNIFNLAEEEKVLLSNMIDTFVDRNMIDKPSLIRTTLSYLLVFFCGPRTSID